MSSSALTAVRRVQTNTWAVLSLGLLVAVLASLALVTLVLKYIVERRVQQQLAQASGVPA